MVNEPTGSLLSPGARTTAWSENCSRSMFFSVSVPSVPRIDTVDRVGHDRRAVAPDDYRVVGALAGEHGGVEVRAGRRQDLTDDAELAGVDFARKHVGTSSTQAIDARDAGVRPVTLMRTLSERSPSMRSSPPRPSMMSLPSPPRMMLPEPNEVTPAPSRSCRPSIRPMLVSTLPGRRGADLAASASSPRRTSLKADPDRPSTSAKRSRIPVFDGATAARSGR